MRKPKHIPYWDRVKKILKANKISQKNFAAFVNLSFSTLKFWMIYGYYPDAKTSCEIAAALGVSTEYLVTGQEMQIIIDHRRKILLSRKAAEDIIKFIKKIETKILLI